MYPRGGNCQLPASLVDRALDSQHGGPGFDSPSKQQSKHPLKLNGPPLVECFPLPNLYQVMGQGTFFKKKKKTITRDISVDFPAAILFLYLSSSVFFQNELEKAQSVALVCHKQPISHSYPTEPFLLQGTVIETYSRYCITMNSLTNHNFANLRFPIISACNSFEKTFENDE